MERSKNLSRISIILILLVVILVFFLGGMGLYLLDIFNTEWMVYGSERIYKLNLEDIKETTEYGVYRPEDQVSFINNKTKSEVTLRDGSKVVISKEPLKELVSKKPEQSIVTSDNNSRNSGCCVCVFNRSN